MHVMSNKTYELRDLTPLGAPTPLPTSDCSLGGNYITCHDYLTSVSILTQPPSGNTRVRADTQDSKKLNHGDHDKILVTQESRQ